MRFSEIGGSCYLPPPKFDMVTSALLKMKLSSTKKQIRIC